jgi:hypothetical protein
MTNATTVGKLYQRVKAHAKADKTEADRIYERYVQGSIGPNTATAWLSALIR